MKKLLASLGLVAALALLPAQMASADIDLTAGVFPDAELAAANSSGHHFAVGGGTTATGTHFAFSAHCKDAGGQCVFPEFGQGVPSGYAVVRDPALGEAQGHVCTADVFAPLGQFHIVVEKGSGALGSFPNLFFFVLDGGQPGSGADVFEVGPSEDCGSRDITTLGGVVTQGNIVVK